MAFIFLGRLPLSVYFSCVDLSGLLNFNIVLLYQHAVRGKNRDLLKNTGLE